MDVDQDKDKESIVADQENSSTVNEEKILSQSELNKIIARTKESTAKKVWQEAEDKYSDKSEKGESSNEDTYENFHDRFKADQEKSENDKYLANVENNYWSNMKSGKESYEDFDKVTEAFKPESFPGTALLSATLDNGGDVIYELSKNPFKMSNLENLFSKSPQLAQSEMTKLSESIKKNKQAVDDSKNNPNSPMQSMSASRSTTGSGDTTIAGLRNDPRLAG